MLAIKKGIKLSYYLQEKLLSVFLFLGLRIFYSEYRINDARNLLVLRNIEDLIFKHVLWQSIKIRILI